MSQIEAKSAKMTEVVIVGAGPYGLSIAAHLAAARVPFRIFGNPMSAWADQMPKGMFLKSEGFASSLSDPGSRFTIGEYCRQEGLPYQDNNLPVALEIFVNYGLAFQKKFVPNLETRMIASIERIFGGFRITLQDGESFLARNVVMAIGITQFAHIPEELRNLPAGLVSHSCVYSDLQHFKDRHVAVVGGGSSAIDLAALMHAAGATVEVFARRPSIRFHNPPRKRSLRERISSPMTGIGMGWDLFFYTKTPHLFRKLPEKVRLDRVRKTLGPAPGWFVRDQVDGKVPIHVSTNVVRARAEKGGVTLDLAHGEETRSAHFDHVIAATGYRVDITTLRILDQELRREIRLTNRSPRLSAHFESSVPGLYFVGVSAANSFGPVMRFAVGAEFTAPRIARRLAKAARRIAANETSTANAPVLKRT